MDGLVLGAQRWGAWWAAGSRWWRERPLLGPCVLVLLTVVAYLPAFDGGFVFDDSIYVTGDARMESVGGLGRIWTEVAGDYQHQYYPLTSTAFWIQRRLWGDRPLGYHLVNVLLHAANALLLWRILSRLGVRGAWLAGAVFAVHPVHVQSVAWVSELKNVMSALFFLLSVLVFLKWFGLWEAGQPDSPAEPGEDSARAGPQPRPAGGPASWDMDAKRADKDNRRPKPWLWYVSGLVLFACALLSKTATCLVPVALALVVWWKRGRLGVRELGALAPLVVMGSAFVGMTVYLESHQGGAQGEMFSQTWVERGLIGGRALWFYAGKLAWPADLSFIYPRWEVEAGRWWWYLYPSSAVAVLSVLGWWSSRGRAGRGALAAVVFFVAALAPVSFVNVAFTRLSYVADHWQYWASMGLIALGSAGVVEWARGRRADVRWAVAGAGAALLCVLSALTWQRCGIYESPRRLWEDTLARNPRAWAVHNNLGNALSDEGRFREAIRCFRAALEINPLSADAYFNLANTRRLMDEPEEAIRCYRRAIELRPGFGPAHNNLGVLLISRGDVKAGADHYRLALGANPDDPKAHNNLGTLLLAQGRLDDAGYHFDRVLRIDPDHAGAHYNMGVMRSRQGRLEEAAAHLEAALDADPGYPQARQRLDDVRAAMGPGGAGARSASAEGMF